MGGQEKEDQKGATIKGMEIEINRFGSKGQKMLKKALKQVNF